MTVDEGHGAGPYNPEAWRSLWQWQPLVWPFVTVGNSDAVVAWADARCLPQSHFGLAIARGQLWIERLCDWEDLFSFGWLSWSRQMGRFCRLGSRPVAK